ncbi:aldehyde oxidase GLOX-like [Canna indica]|uniref:Aldehyde oxidase GLOX-like n=1 Tax=Canna indica TaxID=4628 RepID=A0AAQ3K4C7_9LILI|nr:aldehyde oxidase GLOX-like [Canna indica]
MEMNNVRQASLNLQGINAALFQANVSDSWNDGARVVRTFSPYDDGTCDWVESQDLALVVPHWYASDNILLDGRVIVVGDRRQFNYEFVPKSSPFDATTFALPTLIQQTKDSIENNLYPFFHCNLFIFANNRTILLDYARNVVVRTYPTMPSGDPRNYRTFDLSVLLPLKPSSVESEVSICGGTSAGFSARQTRHRRGRWRRCRW